MQGTSANWRKSSYSGPNGGNCIEVGNAPWRKSTYSGNNGAECVEVGTAAPGVEVHSVVVRDTTDRAGTTLTLSLTAWRALLTDLRA